MWPNLSPYIVKEMQMYMGVDSLPIKQVTLSLLSMF